MSHLTFLGGQFGPSKFMDKPAIPLVLTHPYEIGARKTEGAGLDSFMGNPGHRGNAKGHLLWHNAPRRTYFS